MIMAATSTPVSYFVATLAAGLLAAIFQVLLLTTVTSLFLLAIGVEAGRALWR